ncbi:MAG: J domain-containing protein [Candidatus Limnocylindrales bacterium]
MRATSDLYKVLQVDPEAEHDVIRAAYVCLAKKAHPDAGGAAERMVALNEAWTVLGDSARRATYDQTRRSTPLARAARSEPGEHGTIYVPGRDHG